MSRLRVDLLVPAMAGAQLIELLRRSTRLEAVLVEPAHDELVDGVTHRVFPLTLAEGIGVEIDVPPVEGVRVGRVGLGVEEGHPYLDVPGLLALVARKPIERALGGHFRSFRRVAGAGRFGLRIAPGERVAVPLGPLGELAVRVVPASV